MQSFLTMGNRFRYVLFFLPSYRLLDAETLELCDDEKMFEAVETVWYYVFIRCASSSGFAFGHDYSTSVINDCNIT